MDTFSFYLIDLDMIIAFNSIDDSFKEIKNLD